ncbi:MAG TPA: hypothetical protein PLB05_12005 [Candidatus Omnitrophota bacterium]|nr:hypothetical protein [Candidatus Omnitrophota bacterium]
MPTRLKTGYRLSGNQRRPDRHIPLSPFPSRKYKPAQCRVTFPAYTTPRTFISSCAVWRSPSTAVLSRPRAAHDAVLTGVLGDTQKGADATDGGGIISICLTLT